MYWNSEDVLDFAEYEIDPYNFFQFFFELPLLTRTIIGIIFLASFLTKETFASPAAIAIPDKYAAEVATAILNDGGNAVDVAVAVGFHGRDPGAPVALARHLRALAVLALVPLNLDVLRFGLGLGSDTTTRYIRLDLDCIFGMYRRSHL